MNPKPHKIPYDWSPCPGCYLNHVTVYNTRTGQSFKPICRSYKCVKHGWMHEARLRDALTKHFSKFKWIRLWTFTLSTRQFNEPIEHAHALNKCWRYFVTELRRNRIFNEAQHKTQYVRVTELHQSGYAHFHVLVDTWLDWSVVNALWVQSCKTVLNSEEMLGHTNVRGSMNAGRAAKYVCKYVVKSSKDGLRYMKLWTRSQGVSLFLKKERTESYAIFHELTGVWIGFLSESLLTCLNIEQLHRFATQDSDLHLNLHPPEQK